MKEHFLDHPNKRKYFRLQDSQKHIRLDINGENFIDVLYVRDISEGGIGVSVGHNFAGCAINQPVSLILELPDPVNSIVRTSGRIRHMYQGIFGIQFASLDKKSRDVIRKFIIHHIQQNATPLKKYYYNFKYYCGLPL